MYERYYSGKQQGHVIHKNGRQVALVEKYSETKKIIHSLNCRIMTATIDKDGMLTIIPETELDQYALEKWVEENKEELLKHLNL